MAIEPTQPEKNRKQSSPAPKSAQGQRKQRQAPQKPSAGEIGLCNEIFETLVAHGYGTILRTWDILAQLPKEIKVKKAQFFANRLLMLLWNSVNDLDEEDWFWLVLKFREATNYEYDHAPPAVNYIQFIDWFMQNELYYESKRLDPDWLDNI